MRTTTRRCYFVLIRQFGKVQAEVMKLKLGLVVLVLLMAFQSPTSAQNKKKLASFTAEFKLEEGKKTGMLIIKSKMAEKHYIYALTQKKVPPPTKFRIADSKSYKIEGAFKANKKPTVVEKDEIFNNRIEKHYGEVAFAAPFSIAGEARSTSISITVIGQVCNEDSCTLLREKIVAKFGGYYKTTKNKK